MNDANLQNKDAAVTLTFSMRGHMSHILTNIL